MKAPKIIFVTGATGFVGAHFLKMTQSSGLRLRCLVRRPPPVRLHHVEWVRGDLLKSAAWERKMKGCSAVLHLATVGLPECDRYPMRGSRVIVGGTHQLLECAVRHGVHRVIMASTVEVYGDPSRLPVTEKHPLRPMSLYGFFKACADLDALEMARTKGLSLCILRLFNLYGLTVDGRAPATVLCRMMERMVRAEEVILHASLLNSRDFLHVSDGVRAIQLALKRGEVEGVINVGSGRETTLVAAARKLAQLAGVSLRMDFRPAEGRSRRGRADIRKARQLLGFSPKVSLDHGLQELLDTASHNIPRD